MKLFTLPLLAAFFMSIGCAGWTQGEKVLLAASILAAGADAYTTCNALDNPDNYEVNPMLGEHPSREQVVIYLGFTQAVTILLAHFIPSWRPWLLGLKTGLNTTCAIHNSRLED